MQPEGGDWREILRSARRSAIASLTTEQAAALAANDAEVRAARAARKAAKLERTLFINQRLAHGDTVEEIAEAIGMKERGLRYLAARSGHAVMARKGFRRLAAWVSHKDVAALDALAAENGVTREKMLGIITADALASGAFVARRRRRAAA